MLMSIDHLISGRALISESRCRQDPHDARKLTAHVTISGRASFVACVTPQPDCAHVRVVGVHDCVSIVRMVSCALLGAITDLGVRVALLCCRT